MSNASIPRMPKTRAPRTPKAKLEPWLNASTARRAVLGLALKEFRALFKTRARADWRRAWLQRFDQLSVVENAARTAAQDFARYSVDTARTKAIHVLQAHGADPTLKPWSLAQLRALPPVASELFLYIVTGSREPFILDGETGIQASRKKPHEAWKQAQSVTVLSKTTVEIIDKQGKRHVVEYEAVRLQTGVKWERSGDAGALPDVTSLDGFVIAKFERLKYDAGPDSPFQLSPDGPRRYGTMYATDRELTMISVILAPREVPVSPGEVADHASASELFDKLRHNISNKRKRLGYLETTGEHQILLERMYQPEARGTSSTVTVTESERRAWIAREMRREIGIVPLVPWPQR